MNSKTIVICGAGIAGITTAYYLLKNDNKLNVILIDKNQPLSFTTSKSGENFRDFWPQPCMMQFAAHSIRLMKDLKNEYGDDAFKMTFSGYNFVSLDKDKPVFSTPQATSESIEEIRDRATIQNNYPYLSEQVEKIVRIKNAGGMDVYAMGMLMLKEARKRGLKVLEGEVLAIRKSDTDFQIHLNTKATIHAHQLVIAAGPFINYIANMLDIQLPIENILQQKFIIPDPKNIIPPDMPFTIFADAQYLDWSAEEKDFFAAEKKYHHLLEEFPAGLHVRPDTGGIKMGWAFNTTTSKLPDWEPPTLELFPQIVLKGASRFIPQLAEYENDIPTPLIQYAGYYTRTKENYPLIGPAEMPNVFLVGALAGYGTMGACAAGQLCSKYILSDSNLPDYSRYFHPLRYQNQVLMQEINESQSDGQL